MKKFIRTADGIYEVSEKATYCGKNFYYTTAEVTLEDIDIVKEANTIEELCDGFYLDDKLLNKFNKYAVFEKDELPKVKELFICYTKSKIPFVVYAFIKTSKGLIYVAKMNEKGDLELI